MTARPGNDQAAKALTALHESCRQGDERSLWPQEQIRGAFADGASLEQVGAALGMDEDEAWERLTRYLRTALRKNATANADQSEIEAFELAVAETKALRRDLLEWEEQSPPAVTPTMFEQMLSEDIR